MVKFTYMIRLNNTKKIIYFIIIILILSIGKSVQLYCIGAKDSALFILNILVSLGTCGAVIFGVFKSLPKEEKVEGICSFLPLDDCYPTESNMQEEAMPEIITVKIKNIGTTTIILPDVLYVEIFANETEWGNINIPVENRKIIIPNKTKEFSCKLPDNKGLKHLIANFNDLKIITWTENGTQIECKRTKLYYSKPIHIK